MAIQYIFILAGTGIIAGFSSGLLGVGGAFIMTPMQYAVYASMGLSTDIAVKLAFGTTLFVILPTAISGTWRHNKKGAIKWRISIVMGICCLVSGFAGATLAAHLPGEPLKIAFGVIAMAAAIGTLTSRVTDVDHEPVAQPWLWAAWAIPAGVAVGILGIGGGIIIMLVLVTALRFNMHSAVGTSLAIMIFTSTGAVTGYILNGFNVQGLPDYTIGYIYLPAWLLLVATSFGMAQVGAITAHKLPGKHIRYIFVALVLYMSLRMLGFFEWLGLPL